MGVDSGRFGGGVGGESDGAQRSVSEVDVASDSDQGGSAALEHVRLDEALLSLRGSGPLRDQDRLDLAVAEAAEGGSGGVCASGQATRCGVDDPSCTVESVSWS